MHTDPVAYHKGRVAAARNRLAEVLARRDQQLALVEQRRADWEASRQLVDEALGLYSLSAAPDGPRFFQNYKAASQVSDEAWFQFDRSSRLLAELNREVRQVRFSLNETRSAARIMLTMGGYDQFVEEAWLQS